MALDFSTDFTSTEKVNISDWVNVVLPQKIASLTSQVASTAEIEAIYQSIEDVYLKIYTHFENVTKEGLHKELRWLNGASFADITTSTVIDTVANGDPFATFLFTSGVEYMPLQTAELSGVSDTSLGSSELEGLTEELDEYDRVPPPTPHPDPTTLLDARQKQSDALALQLAAISTALGELDSGEGGYTNLVRAQADAVIAKARVDALIANSSAYSESDRRLQIADRVSGGGTYSALEPLIGITSRASQILTDQSTYVAARYFWLRNRINLRNGSLVLLKGTQRIAADLSTQISDLTAERNYYLSIGAT